MAIFTAIAAVFTGVSAWFAGLSLFAQALIKIGVGLVVNKIAASLAGKPKRTPFGIKGELQRGADIPQSFIIGEYATAGSLVWAEEWGSSGGTPNAYFTQVIELSNLPVKGLNDIWIDGEKRTIISGEDHADYGSPIEEFRVNGTDYAWVKFYDGTQTTADSWLSTAFADGGDNAQDGWELDTNFIGKGNAYAIVTTRFNNDLYQGFPQCLFVIDGIELYDPETGNTGGDGDYNAAIQVYNILKGLEFDGEWFYGAQKINDAQLPDANYIAQKTKSLANFKSGGEIAVNVEIATALEEILATAGGRIAETGGFYKTLLVRPDDSVMTILDGDIITTEEQTFTPFFGLADAVNGISAVYPSPDEGWVSQTAPPLFDSDFEAEDDGRRLLADSELAFVTDHKQVQRLMKLSLKEARRARRHTFTLPPKYWVLEPGDTVTWSSERNGYTNKKFRVDGILDKMNGDVVVDLTEINSNDYDWNDADDFTPVDESPVVWPEVTLQSVPGFNAYAVKIADDAGNDWDAGIRVVWNSSIDDVKAIRIQIKKTSNNKVMFDHNTRDIDSGEAFISERIAPATQYRVRAKIIPFTTRKTQWSSYFDVTTDSFKLNEDNIDPNSNLPLSAMAQDVVDAIDDAAQSASQDVLDATAARNAAELAQDNAEISESRAAALVSGNLYADPSFTSDIGDNWTGFDGGNLAIISHGESSPANSTALEIRSNGNADGDAVALQSVKIPGNWENRKIRIQFKAKGSTSSMNVQAQFGSIINGSLSGSRKSSASGTGINSAVYEHDVIVTIDEASDELELRFRGVGFSTTENAEWIWITDIFAEDVTESQSASGYAMAASGSASAASSSASAASSSASSAQTSFQNAQTQAANASNSATAASSAKDDAESAQAGAVTAKNQAVSVGQQIDLEARGVPNAGFEAGEAGLTGAPAGWLFEMKNDTKIANLEYMSNVDSNSSFSSTLSWGAPSADAGAWFRIGRRFRAVPNQIFQIDLKIRYNSNSTGTPTDSSFIGEDDAFILYEWYDAENNLLSTNSNNGFQRHYYANNSNTTSSSGTWYQWSPGTRTAPANAAYVEIWIIAVDLDGVPSGNFSQYNSWSVGNAAVRFDDVQFISTNGPLIEVSEAEAKAEASAASAEISETAATTAKNDAETAAAAAVVTRDVTATLSSQGVHNNPVFSQWPTASSAPTGWSRTIGSGTWTRNENDAKYGEYCIELDTGSNPSTNEPFFWSDSDNANVFGSDNPDAVTIVAEVELVSGTWGGARLHAFWNNISGGSDGNVYLYLEDHLPSASGTGRVHRIEFYAERPSSYSAGSSRDFRVRFFPNSTEGSGQTQCVIRVHSFQYYEVYGRSQATITQGAVEDLEGASGAAIVMRATSGSAESGLELVAWDDAESGPASQARFTADEIVLDGSVKTQHLSVQARNKVVNPSYFPESNGTYGPNGWNSVGFVDSGPDTDKSLRIDYDGSSGGGYCNSDYFDVDPDKTYKITFAMHNTHGTPPNDIGVYIQGVDKDQNGAASMSKLTPTGTAYTGGTISTGLMKKYDGEINRAYHTAYLLGANVTVSEAPRGNADSYKMGRNVRQARIRCRSYNNVSGTETRAEFWGITVTEVDAGIIKADRVEVADVIKSSNFSSGNSGWRLMQDGSAEFNGPVISRDIVLNNGTYNHSGTLSNGSRLDFFNLGIKMGRDDVWSVSKHGVIVVATITSSVTAPGGITGNNEFWGVSTEVISGARWNGMNGTAPTAAWQKDPSNTADWPDKTGTSQRLFCDLVFHFYGGTYAVNPTIKWKVFLVT